LLRLVSHLDRRETLRKSVGHAVSQRLQPMSSSVRGDEAIWDALQPSQGTISRTFERAGPGRTWRANRLQVVVDLEAEGTCPAW